MPSRRADAVPPGRSVRISRVRAGSRISRLLTACALGVVLVWLAASAAFVSRAAWLGARDADGLLTLARQLPANTAYEHILAREELAAGNPNGAAGWLEGALRRNSRSALLWLDLARARAALGKSEEAVEAASMAQRYHPTSAAVCYDTAIVLFQAGAVARALEALSCAADLVPGRSGEVYDLAWSVVGDGDLVRRAVVPDSASGWRSYFEYARRRRHEEVSPAWEGLVPYGPSPVDRLNYVDFLIGTGRGTEAGRVWAEAYGARGKNLVFNGSFEADSVGRGLDWILGVCDGARTAIVASAEAPHGKRVLEVAFNGSNVHYHHASQAVPVQGGQSYRLRALVRSDRVTSLSMPHLSISGHNGCGMGRIDGRAWGGTVPWSEETLYFTAPPGCSAVIVGIRRDRTDRFDSKISGRIWIDRVELTAIANEPA